MSIEPFVLAFAGFVVLLSVVLAHYHNANGVWLTVCVGANLFQAALTGFCPLAKILKATGVKPGVAFQ